LARSLRLPPELARATAEDVATAVRRDVSAAHGIRVSDVLLLRPGSLPFTSSGKLQRFACRSAYVDGWFAASRAFAGVREGDLMGGAA
jgi:acyl-CoA synthetase (AMP-forming)/AMP-acid ligase II